MSKFRPTSKSFPCEICGNTDGKCSKAREGKELWNCYYFTAPGDTPVTGAKAGLIYKHIGLAKEPLWAKWLRVPAGDVKPRGKSQPKNSTSSTPRILPAPAPELERRPVLSIARRHKLYLQLLDALELADEELLDLDRRGIDLLQAYEWGFRSIEADQVLPEALAVPELPGIARKGGKLTLNTKPGCLCPVKDHLGRIQAFQVRLREGASGGRYRWLRSPAQGGFEGVSSHLSNGELPLAICQPLDPPAEPGKTLALVEGTGAKPFLLAQRLGVPVIGASGGAWARSPKSLEAALRHFAPDQVTLFPDAGATLNRDVLSQYQDLETLLESFGYALKFAWWGQYFKADYDADNISPEKLAQACKEPQNDKQFWALTKVLNLNQLRAVCLSLGIPSSPVPPEYNRKLRPGSVFPESLNALDLCRLRADLEDLAERRRLVSRISRMLARKGLQWEALTPWLSERRYVNTSVDIKELTTGRWPKTKELRELSRDLDGVLEALTPAASEATPGLEAAEAV